MNKLLTLGLIACVLPVSFETSAQDTGAFLAMRQAARDSDAARLNHYLGDELRKTPEDTFLQEEAILSAFYELDLDRAVQYAEALRDTRAAENLATQIALFTNYIQDGNFSAAVSYLENAERLNFMNPVVIEAWGLVNDGDADGALELLGTKGEESGEMAFIFDFQRSMILANAKKDYSSALEILKGTNEPLYMTGLTLFSHIALLKLSGSHEFEPFMNETFGGEESWPAHVHLLLAELEGGEVPPSLGFSSPQSAIAEFALAVVNASRPDQMDYGSQYLLHGFAPNLAPDNAWFVYNYMNNFYIRASKQEQFGNNVRANNEYGDIIKFYDRIDRNSYVRPIAEQSYVNALFALERFDEVKAWTKKAESEAPDMIAFRADAYRRLEDYESAIESYEDAIEITGRNNPEYLWPIYGLAISYERSNQWSQAEQNFLDALKLDPENADILNYLGYSYVDRGEKLDTGLEMIERAVDLAPKI